jgi:hypothetical protein
MVPTMSGEPPGNPAVIHRAEQACRYVRAAHQQAERAQKNAHIALYLLDRGRAPHRRR